MDDLFNMFSTLLNSTDSLKEIFKDTPTNPSDILEKTLDVILDAKTSKKKEEEDLYKQYFE